MKLKLVFFGEPQLWPGINISSTKGKVDSFCAFILLILVWRLTKAPKAQPAAQNGVCREDLVHAPVFILLLPQ